MKIIGVGLNKTGTKTLGACLRHWGYKHTSWSHQAFEFWQTSDQDALMQLVEQHDSFEDWPWPLVYQTIDAHFPGSKFILTRRISPEAWFASLCKHAARTGSTVFRKAIYGYDVPDDHKKEHLDYYEHHLASVRAYFSQRPTALLEVCWEEGDGWPELAAFLGREVPSRPLPHLNKSPQAKC